MYKSSKRYYIFTLALAVLLTFLGWSCPLVGSPLQTQIYFEKDIYHVSNQNNNYCETNVTIINKTNNVISSCRLRTSCGCIKTTPSSAISLQPGKNQLKIQITINLLETRMREYFIYLEVPNYTKPIKASIILNNKDMNGWQYNKPKTLFIGKKMSYGDFKSYDIDILYFSSEIENFEFSPLFNERKISIVYAIDYYKEYAKISLKISPTILWINGRNTADIKIFARNKLNNKLSESDVITVVGELSCPFDTSEINTSKYDDILIPIQRSKIISVFSERYYSEDFLINEIKDEISSIRCKKQIMPDYIVICYLHGKEKKYICLNSSYWENLLSFEPINENKYKVNAKFPIHKAQSCDKANLSIILYEQGIIDISGEGIFELTLKGVDSLIRRKYHFVAGHFSCIE